MQYFVQHKTIIKIYCEQKRKKKNKWCYVIFEMSLLDDGRTRSEVRGRRMPSSWPPDWLKLK